VSLQSSTQNSLKGSMNEDKMIKQNDKMKKKHFIKKFVKSYSSNNKTDIDINEDEQLSYRERLQQKITIKEIQDDEYITHK